MKNTFKKFPLFLSLFVCLSSAFISPAVSAMDDDEEVSIQETTAPAAEEVSEEVIEDSSSTDE